MQLHTSRSNWWRRIYVSFCSLKFTKRHATSSSVFTFWTSSSRMSSCTYSNTEVGFMMDASFRPFSFKIQTGGHACLMQPKWFWWTNNNSDTGETYSFWYLCLWYHHLPVMAVLKLPLHFKSAWTSHLRRFYNMKHLVPDGGTCLTHRKLV